MPLDKSGSSEPQQADRVSLQILHVAQVPDLRKKSHVAQASALRKESHVAQVPELRKSQASACPKLPQVCVKMRNTPLVRAGNSQLSDVVLAAQERS